jgi:hypothetical protein
MCGYRENQAEAAKMFEERKRDMQAQKPAGSDAYFKGGDENSKYYTKPDEAPISHPAEVLERLQKEKPDVDMEELVKEADAIVAQEMKQRQEQREKDAMESMEKDAKDRGFNSIEAMQKFDSEKERREKEDLAVEIEAKKAQVENSVNAQVKEEEIGGEEEVSSENKENIDPEA